MRNIHAMVLAAGVLVFSSAAQADDCQLKELASLDIVTSNNGAILVPLKVEGTSAYFELDIGGFVSGLSSEMANQLRLRLFPLPSNIQANFEGPDAKLMVKPNVTLGGGTGETILAVIPDGSSLDPRVAGILAFDILKNFDVELDLAHNKFNLFSPDHCEGKVIYWTHTAPAAAIPLEMRGFNGFVFPMKLDGKDVETQIDTSVNHASLSSSVAAREFDIADDAPANSGPDSVDANGKPYTFKTLAADGITITNPQIHIYHDASNGACYGQSREQPHTLHDETDTKLVRCFGSRSWSSGAPRCSICGCISHSGSEGSTSRRRMQIRPPTPRLTRHGIGLHMAVLLRWGEKRC